MARLRRHTLPAAFLALQALFLLNCGGGGTTGSPSPAIFVSLSPRTVTVLTRATQQFTATVGGSSNQDVSWSVNDVAAGNTTLGTIDASGLYAAPAIPPSPNTVTVKATSAADPTRTASASVAVVNPAPLLSSISPKAATAFS